MEFYEDFPILSPKEYAKNLLGLFPLEQVEKAVSSSSFAEYRDDPAAFGRDVLGYDYTDEIIAMMESVRDNPITLARSANATGKTHGAASVAVWFFKSFKNAQVYTAAAPPERNLKRLLWGEINTLIDKHPSVFAGERAMNLHVERAPQEFLTGVTIPMSGTVEQREAKFSGKHAEYLLFIIDEGDAVPDEVYRGIESCMSGGHARLLIMMNPRAKLGTAYRLERNGTANVVHISALNHPNVVTGKNIIPGAVNRETTVRRIHEWCRPENKREKDSHDSFTLPKFLVGKRARGHSGKMLSALKGGKYRIMDPAFSYMVLGQYPSQASNQLISEDWILKARTRWDVWVDKHGEMPPSGARGIMGLDVGEFGTDPSCSCFRYGGFVEQLITWSGVDTQRTGDRAVAEMKARKIIVSNVDATGVGAGVAPHMNDKGAPASPVKVASAPSEESPLGKFKILRDQLWWAAREWLRIDPGAMLPPDEELTEELQTPTYKDENGFIRVMDKDTMRDLLKRSPNKADALCLTFYSPPALIPEFDRARHVGRRA